MSLAKGRQSTLIVAKIQQQQKIIRKNVLFVGAADDGSDNDEDESDEGRSQIDFSLHRLLFHKNTTKTSSSSLFS